MRIPGYSKLFIREKLLGYMNNSTSNQECCHYEYGLLEGAVQGSVAINHGKKWDIYEDQQVPHFYHCLFVFRHELSEAGYHIRHRLLCGVVGAASVPRLLVVVGAVGHSIVNHRGRGRGKGNPAELPAPIQVAR